MHTLWKAQCPCWHRNCPVTEQPSPVVQCIVSSGQCKTVTYSLGEVHENHSAEVESIFIKHRDKLVEPCTVLALLFPNMWRISQVVTHQRSVYSEKILKLAILGKGPRESGYLGMNCIDVRGRAFDHNIDDQKPEGLLRTSLQAVNKLDRNQNRKLSLGVSKEEWFKRIFQEKDVKRKIFLVAPSAIERWRAQRMSGRSY